MAVQDLTAPTIVDATPDSSRRAAPMRASGRVLLLTGAPGVGKTTLIRERLRDAVGAWLEARGVRCRPR